MADWLEHLQRVVEFVDALVQDRFSREEISASTPPPCPIWTWTLRCLCPRDLPRLRTQLVRAPAGGIRGGDQNVLTRAERPVHGALAPLRHRFPAPTRLSAYLAQPWATSGSGRGFGYVIWICCESMGRWFRRSTA